MKDKLQVLKELKNGDELYISQTNSLIQGIPIKGKCYFDSWDYKHKTLFVYFDNQPRGKRFLIEAKNII